MYYYEAVIKEMNELIASPSEENLFELKSYLSQKDADTHERHIFPYYVSRMFLSLGAQGIQILRELIDGDPGRILPIAILENLYFAT